MKLVKNLKVTSLQKCIIMMSGIDIEIDDICDFLRASKESVRSQRSKMSEDIERIFGRKPWMKKKSGLDCFERENSKNSLKLFKNE